MQIRMLLMHSIRLLYRVPLALLWTLGVHYLGIRIPQLFYPKRRFLRAVSLWGSGLAFIMGIRIHQVNAPPAAMGDIIVANHMGFLDIPVLLRFFPSVFVIKMEMRKVFFFGGCLAHQGHVFVKRDSEQSRRDAREGIKRVLLAGDRVIVFPEGRASSGAERLPFAPASFAIAMNHNKTVQACVLDYLPDRSFLKWDTSRAMQPQLVALFGRRRIDVSIEFLGVSKVTDPGRAAQELHDQIQQKLKTQSK